MHPVSSLSGESPHTQLHALGKPRSELKDWRKFAVVVMAAPGAAPLLAKIRCASSMCVGFISVNVVLNERMVALEAEMKRFEANCEALNEYQASLYKVAEIWVRF